MVGCPSAQTTTIMYLRTVYLKINLKLNNIFCYCLNFAFLSLLIIKSSTHKSVSGHLWYVGPYKVKRIILTNAIELELPSTIKIHPVVNISRVYMYKDQVKDQRKGWLLLVVIKGEEKYKVEKILNKRKFKGKDRYLV